MGNCKRRTASRITCPNVTCPGGRGYPIQYWLRVTPFSPGPGGNPSRPGQGVPHLVLVRGVPFQSWPGGYFNQAWQGGSPFSPGQRGTPSSPGRGYPGKGHWISGTIIGFGWGTPRKDLGPVEVLWDEDGYPPLRQTD